MTKQRMLLKRTLINDLTFRMPQQVLPETTTGTRVLKFTPAKLDREKFRKDVEQLTSL